MSGKHGRRAWRLQIYRSSLAHHVRIHGIGRAGQCAGCNESGTPIKLTAKAASASVHVHIKPDEFSRLLWGAQSWRRPH